MNLFHVSGIIIRHHLGVRLKVVKELKMPATAATIPAWTPFGWSSAHIWPSHKVNRGGASRIDATVGFVDKVDHIIHLGGLNFAASGGHGASVFVAVWIHPTHHIVATGIHACRAHNLVRGVAQIGLKQNGVSAVISRIIYSKQILGFRVRFGSSHRGRRKRRKKHEGGADSGGKDGRTMQKHAAIRKEPLEIVGMLLSRLLVSRHEYLAGCVLTTNTSGSNNGTFVVWLDGWGGQSRSNTSEKKQIF